MPTIELPESWEHLQVRCSCGELINPCFGMGARNRDGVVFEARLPPDHPDGCEDCLRSRRSAREQENSLMDAIGPVMIKAWQASREKAKMRAEYEERGRMLG